MQRNISTLLIAATLVVGIPRLAGAQTTPLPSEQVAPVGTPLAPLPASNLQGDSPPPGYHIEKRRRLGLIIAGSIVLGAVYSGGLVLAAHNDSSTQAGWLYLPVLGPWIAMGKLGSYDESACGRNSFSSSGCFSKKAALTAYAILGIGQLTGVALITAGIVFPSGRLVPDALAKNGITVVPLYAGNTPSGLAVAGRF